MSSPSGDLNTNKVMRALLQYLNTPLRGVTDSPAKIVFGRPISDSLPKSPMKKDWTSRNHHNELGVAKIRATYKEKLDVHTKTLPPLKVGEPMQIQNQTGPNMTRWDKTGMVVENHRNRQYSMKVDGSCCVTLRNRWFLKNINPVMINDNMTTMWMVERDAPMASPAP